MRDGRTNDKRRTSEDRATQPMETGGWVSQKVRKNHLVKMLERPIPSPARAIWFSPTPNSEASPSPSLAKLEESSCHFYKTLLRSEWDIWELLTEVNKLEDRYGWYCFESRSDWNDRNATLLGEIKLMAASEMVNNDLLLLVCFKMHHFGVKSDGWMCWLKLLILPFLWWNFQAKTITHTLESKHCKYVEVKTCEARQWKHIQF